MFDVKKFFIIEKNEFFLMLNFFFLSFEINNFSVIKNIWEMMIMTTGRTPMIKARCANCGKSISTPLNRFPLCDCGHTIPIFYDTKYAVYKNDHIEFWQKDRMTQSTPLTDHQALLHELQQVSFMTEQDTIPKILNLDDKYKDIVSKWTAAEILLHNIYYNKSEVYRDALDCKEYDLARVMLQTQEFKQYNTPEQKEHFSRIHDYLKDSNDYLISLDCCLAGEDVVTSDILSSVQITIADLRDLEKNTQFSKLVLIRFIVEFSSVMISGAEAIEKIKKYDYYITELSKLPQAPLVMIDPSGLIYQQYYLAETTYTIYKRKRLFTYSDYISRFNAADQYIHHNNMLIKPLNAQDIKDIPANMLPEEPLTETVLGVYSLNKELLSIFYNHNNISYLKGQQSDQIKKALNLYFDTENY